MHGFMGSYNSEVFIARNSQLSPFAVAVKTDYKAIFNPEKDIYTD